MRQRKSPPARLFQAAASAETILWPCSCRMSLRVFIHRTTDSMRAISMAIFADGRAFSGRAFVYTSVHPFGDSQQF